MIAASVLGLITAIATPAILSIREAARQHHCSRNLSRLGVALGTYHDVHATYPPAAVWSTHGLHSLALQTSKRIDLFTHANWAQMLLPYVGEEDLAQRFDRNLPVASDANESARMTSLSLMTCPSDDYNRSDNPHRFEPTPDESIGFARGNYAINGGTHSWKTTPDSTAALSGDAAHLEIDSQARTFRFWGNGIAGFNVAFSRDDFTNGTSTLVALEEIRAGIHPLDPRGAWALGQVGASVTWAHGVNGDAYGPNNPHPRSDDILGCAKLHENVGTEVLQQEGMPCVSYIDQNNNATARSRHSTGVNVLFLDGAVRFISNDVDPGLWHVMHSRETPAKLLNALATRLAIHDYEDAPRLVRHHKDTPDEKLQLTTNSIGMHFVLLPPGEFRMGAPDVGNEFDLPHEAPSHNVRLTRGVYLGKCEVTQGEYAIIMGLNPSFHKLHNELSPALAPVEQVSWDDANDFCSRLSMREEELAAGRSYRLPTEAEWEFACRAGEAEPFVWRPDRNKADKSGEAVGVAPPLPISPVGSYPPNAFGLHDMRGNVWEWCADWFDRDYYLRSSAIDPQGPRHGYLRIVRGGDWIFIGEGCKINYTALPPWKRSPFIGFRVVCEMHGRRTGEAPDSNVNTSAAKNPGFGQVAAAQSPTRSPFPSSTLSANASSPLKNAA